MWCEYQNSGRIVNNVVSSCNPSLSHFPTSLSATFLLLKTSPAHHRHTAAPLPEREEGWAPAPRAVSRILDFLWCRLWPAWMNLTWALQTGKSCPEKASAPFCHNIHSLTDSHHSHPRWSTCTPPKGDGYLEVYKYQECLRFPHKQQEHPFELQRGEIALVSIRFLNLENWKT